MAEDAWARQDLKPDENCVPFEAEQSVVCPTMTEESFRSSEEIELCDLTDSESDQEPFTSPIKKKLNNPKAVSPENKKAEVLSVSNKLSAPTRKSLGDRRASSSDALVSKSPKCKSPTSDKENQSGFMFQENLGRNLKPKLLPFAIQFKRHFSFPAPEGEFLGIKRRKLRDELLDQNSKIPYKLAGQEQKFIVPETLIAIKKGVYKAQFQNVKILDCRFVEEFLGGHIDDAIHIGSFDELRENFHNDLKSDESLVIIFYCEFSSHRGPSMYNAYRKFDRNFVNYQEYPKLHVPDIFILEGGYKKFFEDHQEHCQPQSYLPMKQVEGHDAQLELFNRQFSKAMKWKPS